MLAFAANSLLCRAALEAGAIDAGSFTVIRVGSGALALLLLLVLQGRMRWRARGNWAMGAMLFVYMIGFSLAYQSLGAATGALLLFGAVQLTMLGWSLRSGERFSGLQWVGLVLAIAGLVILLAPGATAPDLLGAVLMGAAGLAWGGYSLLGRGASDPIADTAGNFVLALPLTALAWLLIPPLAGLPVSISAPGVWLAIASGVLASGFGYAVWYAALPRLAAGQAATVQLSVPVIAAVGAVVLLGEPLGLRLLLAGSLTLLGVWLTLHRPRA